MIVIATAITLDYLKKAQPLLRSFRYLHSCKCWVVTVGFDLPATDYYQTARLEPTGKPALQQGQVLDALPPLDPDDILVMVDADGLFQRDFTKDELDWLLGANDFLIGPNRLELELGEEEYRHLSPTYSIEEFEAVVPVRNVPVYNCGFMAARVSTWKALRKEYDQLDRVVGGWFGNWRYCQLLFCCCLRSLGMHVKEASRILHCHGHSGLPSGSKVDNGVLSFQGETVLYAHYVEGLSWATQWPWPYLVTCVILSHNKPAYVNSAIGSLLGQTYSNWQGIVIDSGVLLDQDYSFPSDTRLRVIRSTETQEIRDSLHIASWCVNQAWKEGRIKGDLVFYLSDDDLLHCQAFEHFVNFFNEYPEQVVCYGSQDIYHNEKVSERLATDPVTVGGIDCRIDGSQFCIRRQLLERVTWPEDRAARLHADGLFFEEVARVFGPILPIPHKVSIHRRVINSQFC